MSQVITPKTQAALSLASFQAAIELYEEQFEDEAWLLIVSESDYFPAKEILHGGDRYRLEVSGWMPSGIWMLTGARRRGLFYSGTFA